MKTMRFVTAKGYCITGKLFAGTAKVSITPVTDEPLHDPVYARSLVLQINGERLAFVSVDLAVFTSENVEKACKEQFGVSKVFLCSSHNHTEPSKPGKGPEYANLKSFYESQIVRAVEQYVPGEDSRRAQEFSPVGIQTPDRSRRWACAGVVDGRRSLWADKSGPHTLWAG